MAVTITAADLATAIGKKPEIATRLLPVSSILVERYAPNAPTEIQNEAVIRCSGWLANQPASACSRDQVALPGGLGQIFAFRPSTGALRGSGAMGLLSTFKVRRGGLISGSAVSVPASPSTTDQGGASMSHFRAGFVGGEPVDVSSADYVPGKLFSLEVRLAGYDTVVTVRPSEADADLTITTRLGGLTDSTTQGLLGPRGGPALILSAVRSVGTVLAGSETLFAWFLDE